MLPTRELEHRGLEVVAVVARPELLVVDAMTAFHLAVLLRSSGLDVAHSDAELLAGEREDQRELRAVVDLDPPDRKRQFLLHVVQERQAGPLILPTIQPQDPDPRAVVNGGVLKPREPSALHHFHVDLDRVTWLIFLKQLQLPRSSPRGLGQVRQAQVSKHPLNGPGRHADLVDSIEPDPCATRAESVLCSGLLDQADDAVIEAPSPPPRGIPGQQSRLTCDAPAIAPHADRLSVQAKVPAGGLHAILFGVAHDSQTLLHSEPVTGWNLHGRHNPPRRRGHYP